jgi:hypothetical protein
LKQRKGRLNLNHEKFRRPLQQKSK